MSTPQRRFGPWSVRLLQRQADRRALVTATDSRLEPKARRSAARKVLRDGSRYAWLMLLEWTHEAFHGTDRAALWPLCGALRVKALKILSEPSSDHAQDHLSAMKWLEHAPQSGDVALFKASLFEHLKDPIYPKFYALVPAHFRAHSHDQASRRALLAALLFELPCPQLNTLRETLTALRWDDEAIAMVRHAFEINRSVEVRRLCLEEVLYERLGRRFDEPSQALFEEISDPRYEDFWAENHLMIRQLLEERAERQRQHERACVMLAGGGDTARSELEVLTKRSLQEAACYAPEELWRMAIHHLGRLDAPRRLMILKALSQRPDLVSSVAVALCHLAEAEQDSRCRLIYLGLLCHAPPRSIAQCAALRRAITSLTRRALATLEALQDGERAKASVSLKATISKQIGFEALAWIEEEEAMGLEARTILVEAMAEVDQSEPARDEAIAWLQRYHDERAEEALWGALRSTLGTLRHA